MLRHVASIGSLAVIRFGAAPISAPAVVWGLLALCRVMLRSVNVFGRGGDGWRLACVDVLYWGLGRPLLWLSVTVARSDG